VPLEFAACQGDDVESGAWLITPITNGLGAGLSFEGEEQRALEAMLAWLPLDQARMRAMLADTVFAARAHIPFSSLPTTDTPADDAAARLHEFRRPGAQNGVRRSIERRTLALPCACREHRALQGPVGVGAITLVIVDVTLRAGHVGRG